MPQLGDKMLITEKIKNYIAKRKWRKENAHNFTTIAFEVDLKKVIVGNGTYGELTVYNNGTDSVVKQAITVPLDQMQHFLSALSMKWVIYPHTPLKQ